MEQWLEQYLSNDDNIFLLNKRNNVYTGEVDFVKQDYRMGKLIGTNTFLFKFDTGKIIERKYKYEFNWKK